MFKQIPDAYDDEHTVPELDSNEWKLVKKGFLHEYWQREAVVNKKGMNVRVVEVYKTWGFGLMPPPSCDGPPPAHHDGSSSDDLAQKEKAVVYQREVMRNAEVRDAVW